MVIWETREKTDPDLILIFFITIARNKAINILRKREFNLTDGFDLV